MRMSGYSAPRPVQSCADHGHGAEDADHQEHRHPGYGHDGHEYRAAEITGDHHLPARQPVGQPRQSQATDESRHDADGKGDSGQQRRACALEDQQGERDPGQLIPGDGQHLGRPQRPELRDPEDLAEGRWALRRSDPAGRGLVVQRDPGFPACDLLLLQASPPPPLRCGRPSVGAGCPRPSAYDAWSPANL